MFEFINRWLNHRIIKKSTITNNEWEVALVSLPILNGLSKDELSRLKKLVILFMHHKVFEGAYELKISRNMALIIALQACLPILNLGLPCYDNWVSIIVYPTGFAPERTITDENGVVHNVKSNLSGEAWQRGPIVLAWDDAETAGIIDGHNLVVHEFSHKLDMQNGVANGFPPLHADMQIDKWVSAFTAGFKHFQKKCKSGHVYGIDCYAATSPAEFFAVLSEVFFERPSILKKHYADIYEQLRKYYKQDPFIRLKNNHS